jgi:hypothetical protein
VVADFKSVKAGGLGVGSIGRSKGCLKKSCMQSLTPALLVALYPIAGSRSPVPGLNILLPHFWPVTMVEPPHDKPDPPWL